MFKFPTVIAARLTAAVLAKADEIAPHLKCVRICFTDQDKVGQYQAAFAEIGFSIPTLKD